MTGHRIFTTKFSSVYPLYVQKAERKGRTQAEVDQVIRWLTGYSQEGLEAEIRIEPRKNPPLTSRNARRSSA